MRVYIGPYRDWIGPYQLAAKIPFISESASDKIGDWLASTWVNDLCHWIDDRKERKIEIRIDKCDTWNMDHTLALIILPMLKQLKKNKNGSPYVDDEDVPSYMRHSDPKIDEYGWDSGDNWVHYKWEWIMNEMIWTFEHLVDDSWEEKYYSNGEFDKRRYKEVDDRIANGLRLFGKYYRGLWD